MTGSLVPATRISPRVLILGAGGQLGAELARQFTDSRADAWEVRAMGRAEVDFTDLDAVRQAVRGFAPTVTINAAAYTAVDRAEAERDLAFTVNAAAPGALAEEMTRLGGWLLHYSTDYVFNGSGELPWRETDTTGPLNVYGASKLAGELAIAASGAKHLIFRTSWVYAAEGRNFLHTMLRLGRERERLTIVSDQIGAPTTAEALAAATLSVVEQVVDGREPEPGLYHLACAGETSWAGFAEAIFAAFAARQRPPVVAPIPTEEYPTPAQRPRNSRLSCDKFAGEFGERLPDWRAALDSVAARILAETGTATEATSA